MANNKYTWSKATTEVGHADNIPGAIKQWSRTTVADGKWMNVEQLLPLSGRDQYLLDSINDVYNTATSTESKVADLLEDEIKRAKASESTLSTAITNEISRATGQEQSLLNHINAEEARAKTAETTISTNLQAKLATEEHRAAAAESALQTSINTETSRAKAQEDLIYLGYETLNNKLNDTVPLLNGNGIDFESNVINFKFNDGNNISGTFDADGNVIFDLIDSISATTVNSDLNISQNTLTTNTVSDNGYFDTLSANNAEFDILKTNDATFTSISTQNLTVNGAAFPIYTSITVNDTYQLNNQKLEFNCHLSVEKNETIIASLFLTSTETIGVQTLNLTIGSTQINIHNIISSNNTICIPITYTNKTNNNINIDLTTDNEITTQISIQVIGTKIK